MKVLAGRYADFVAISCLIFQNERTGKGQFGLTWILLIFRFERA